MWTCAGRACLARPSGMSSLNTEKTYGKILPGEIDHSHSGPLERGNRSDICFGFGGKINRISALVLEGESMGQENIFQLLETPSENCIIGS